MFDNVVYIFWKYMWMKKCVKICLEFVWIEFIVIKTENWKHCSKIIFKCVNYVVGLVNSTWIVFFVLYTVKSCDFTVHMQEKKNFENATPLSMESVESKQALNVI